MEMTCNRKKMQRGRRTGPLSGHGDWPGTGGRAIWPRGSMLTEESRPSAESNHQINGLVDRPIIRSGTKRMIRSTRCQASGRRRDGEGIP